MPGKTHRPIAGVIALGGGLFALWLLLSGHYTPLFFLLGAISTAFALLSAVRMDFVDEEGVPAIHLSRRMLTYVPWLVREVWRSNLAVARIVLGAKLAISPTVVSFQAKQRTVLGRVIMANSITLTPGTITLAVVGNTLHVHALSEESVDGIEDGEMNRRVAELERQA